MTLGERNTERVSEEDGPKDQDRVSSERRYSPMSDWWKATMVPGSALLQSCTDLAATPKPCSQQVIEFYYSGGLLLLLL